jgi:hypothetical protein
MFQIVSMLAAGFVKIVFHSAVGTRSLESPAAFGVGEPVYVLPVGAFALNTFLTQRIALE